MGCDVESQLVGSNPAFFTFLVIMAVSLTLIIVTAIDTTCPGINCFVMECDVEMMLRCKKRFK